MTVYLVGAGPGDPDLVTVRGAQVLGRAEVVVHDGRIPIELLDLVPPSAEVIPLGDQTGSAVVDLLVRHGLAGRHVVHLVAGDPTLFQAGGEIARALMAAGVDTEVVPGVTAAIAAPAAAGMAVTSDETGSAFVVIDGRGAAPARFSSPDPDSTIVVVGVDRWAEIATALLDSGLAADTPATAVRWGTRPDQQTTRSTLGALSRQQPPEPTVVVVGHAASADPGWLERLPLFGKRVLVTRTRAQASTLSHLLRRRGASPIEVPTIEIVEPVEDAPVAAAIEHLADYEWLVVTSPNGASRFCDRLPDARALGGVRIAAIGPGTAQALADRNLVADLVPDRYVAEGLLEVFPPPERSGRVLLARAAEARDVLPEGLADAGWLVDVVAVYRTVRPEPVPSVRAAVAEADVVTFTSSSTVRHFVELFGVEAMAPTVACIGPVTASTARELGVSVTVEAPTHTIAGLVEALEAHFTR